MGNFIILSLHLIFLIYIVVKKYKSEAMSGAVTNAILILLLFSVGWSLVSLVVNNLISPEGFGKDFDRSTISLFILTIGEFFFYRKYYAEYFSGTKSVESITSNDTEKQ